MVYTLNVIGPSNVLESTEGLKRVTTVQRMRVLRTRGEVEEVEGIRESPNARHAKPVLHIDVVTRSDFAEDGRLARTFPSVILFTLVSGFTHNAAITIWIERLVSALVFGGERLGSEATAYGVFRIFFPLGTA
jgi:hypothetical protein